uniref:Uncharacterized protein n=1 Tax=Arundo donax TaxID=35708 RepID=A0A0A9E9Y9_ARUDO
MALASEWNPAVGSTRSFEQRAGRPSRVEQPRLLGRRWNPRLLPLCQARAPAIEGGVVLRRSSGDMLFHC